MRLFITSYQKSGTHQIMPMFDNSRIPDVVDRSQNSLMNIPQRFGCPSELSEEGIQETVKQILNFPSRAFGHLSYLPEYEDAFRIIPTKVLFNIRDPRDVIIAELENGLKHKGGNVPAWLDFVDDKCGQRIFEKYDPIPDLIEIAAARWPRWFGWLNCDFVMPVKYEDLRLNTLETTLKIFEFIAPHPAPDILSAISRASPRPENPTFRRGVPGEWKERFTEKQKDMCEKLLGDIIERLGYRI